MSAQFGTVFVVLLLVTFGHTSEDIEAPDETPLRSEVMNRKSVTCFFCVATVGTGVDHTACRTPSVNLTQTTVCIEPEGCSLKRGSFIRRDCAEMSLGCTKNTDGFVYTCNDRDFCNEGLRLRPCLSVSPLALLIHLILFYY